MYQLSRILLVIGGLNLGLIGLGHFLEKDLNVIELFSKFDPMLPTIIYLAMGASAIVWMFRKY